MPSWFTSAELVEANAAGAQIDVAAYESMTPGIAHDVVVPEECDMSLVIGSTDENHRSCERLLEVVVLQPKCDSRQVSKVGLP